MKKFLTLLLVAMMCLSFVACGGESGNTETPSSGENTENNGGTTNDPNNQGSENNGSNLVKIERGTVTTSENPLLPILLESIGNKYSYTFKEDGTCSNIEYWWIDKESEDYLHIYIAEEYKWKYYIEAKRGIDVVTVYVNECDGVYENFTFWNCIDSYDIECPNAEQ